MSSVTSRLRQWLAETHGPVFELTRHFFLRLFDTDMVTAPGQLERVVIGAFAVLCSFTTYWPAALFRKYVDISTKKLEHVYHTTASEDRLMFLLFPMLVVALVAVLEWRSLFPADRDYLILMPLPISRLQMFAAKFLALTLFVGLFALGSGGFPTIILPLVQESIWTPQPGLRDIACHAVALTAALGFTFSAFVALQGVLINLGQRIYPRVSLMIQSVMLLALLCAVPHVFSLPGMFRRGEIAWGVLEWLPPFWFLGIYESLLGGVQGRQVELASRGWWGLAVATAAALLTYLLSYFRQASAQAESDNRQPFPVLQAVYRTMLRLLRRPAAEHAVVSFIFKTLARSRQHKLVLAVFFGIGLAILINTYFLLFWIDPLTRRPEALQDQTVDAALSAPLVLAFFFLTGIRIVFSLPSELQANWLFRAMESETERPHWLNAVETSVYLIVVAPMLIVAAPFVVPTLGWEVVPAHLAVCTMLGLILVELVLWEWQKVPFVCSFPPGQRNAGVTVVLYLFAFGLYAYASTAFEAWCFRDPPRLLILFGLLLAGFAKLREARTEQWGRIPLTYEAADEPEVRTLDLMAD